MASVRVILRKRATSENKYPILIQIIKDRKKSIITLGHSIDLKDWDEVKRLVKKSHPNSARLNNMIAKKLSEASDKLIELETANTDTSSRSVMNAFKASKQGTFSKQAAVYLQQLKQQGKFNQYSADSPRVERFKEFLNGGDITFPEITPVLIKKYKNWLKGTRTITERTAVNHLVVIRTIFNQAIASKLVDSKYYPFGKGGVIIKFPDSLKIGLTMEEVNRIEQAELDKLPNHARNLWLFSFYFAGMRISDVLRLKWSDFQNDRLFYTMGKNDKGGSLKVPSKVLQIMEQYKRPNPKHDLVFPDLEKLDNLTDNFVLQSYIKARIKASNEQLPHVAKAAEIDKTITMHIARHTFGNISGDKIPIQMLQKLYRHSSITTTIGYQANFINKDADDALDAVIGF